MTTPRTTDRTPTTAPRSAPTDVVRPIDRARVRDFGVGYGNSSGYATARRYASNWGQPRFRCA